MVFARDVAEAATESRPTWSCGRCGAVGQVSHTCPFAGGDGVCPGHGRGGYGKLRGRVGDVARWGRFLIPALSPGETAFARDVAEAATESRPTWSCGRCGAG